MDLMPGEVVQWQEVARTRRFATAITVTNQRLATECHFFGAKRLQYVPLDKIDYVEMGRSRSPFNWVVFPLLCLLFLVPGILYLLNWFFFPNHTSQFHAGDQEIKLEWAARQQDPMAVELLAAVEAARQSLVSVNPLPEPIQVALNP